MANEPIDRTNRNDVLMQIGYVKATISQLNKDIGQIDKDMSSAENQIQWLFNKKEQTKKLISDKHNYINQLKNDLKNI